MADSVIAISSSERVIAALTIGYATADSFLQATAEQLPWRWT